MSCFSWAFRSHKRIVSKDSDAPFPFVLQKVDEGEGWHSPNGLSLTSTASSSSNLHANDIFVSEEEEEFAFELLPELARADVQDEHLFVQGDGHSTDGVVRVEALEESPTGQLLILVDGRALEAATEDLLVDCRATPQDDPKFTKLVGTRLCVGGRTSQLLLRRGATAITASVFCEILAAGRGDDEVRTVPLAEAVAAVRQARLSRDQAADLVRQRQFNDRVMGQMRRRALGFS